jgi:ATP-dependent RNA helicase UAP56/SUB2
MSAHDNEELIDYEDEHDVVANGAPAPSASAVAVAQPAADGVAGDEKKNFSGIHSTGFRHVTFKHDYLNQLTHVLR